MNKRIITTPAGRQRYMEILFKHLKREYENNGFHEWNLWVNTNNTNDIYYMKYLADNHKWIKLIEIPDIKDTSISNIHKFFKLACNPDCVYLRLDDDIVFLENGFCDKMFKYRIENPEPFLVYGNIINNAVISHIHQKYGCFNYHKLGGYKCMDDVGWNDAEYAEAIHRQFIKDVKENNIDKWKRTFTLWVCDKYERVSINAICWLGSTFKEFDGEVGNDEEDWLSVVKPKMLGRPNVIINDAICCHFAFHTQRNHLDNTDILHQYRDL